MHVYWGAEDDLCDQNGFDKKYRPILGSDDYVIDDYILPSGIIICRYGYPGGRFTTIKGTPYKMLSLPYKEDTVQYHEYEVVDDISVKCIVTKGRVAAKFGSAGGAIQFMHKQSVFNEVRVGKLKEAEAWIWRQNA